jgi:hypothetical protein
MAWPPGNREEYMAENSADTREKVSLNFFLDVFSRSSITLFRVKWLLPYQLSAL